MNKRREFLKSLSLMSLGALWPHNGHTQEASLDHFLLMIFLPGGWDTTLCLDPWVGENRPLESELFLEYHPNEVFQVGENFFGPSMVAMKPFLSQCSVINGLTVSIADNGHPAAKSYVTTGTINGLSGAMTVEIDKASAFAPPLGSLFNQSLYTGVVPPQIMSLASVEKFKSGEFFMAELLRNLKNINTHQSELVKTQGQYADNLELMQKIGKDLLLNPFPEASKNVQEAWQAAICFKNQAARTCLIELLDFQVFDTHSNHPVKHLKALTQAWQMVADILRLYQSIPFQSGSLFDSTTFVVISEFSRTTALNASKGKDHNTLTNSALLVGKGIKKGLRIGASKLIESRLSPVQLSYQIAVPFDFTKGQAIDSKNCPSFICPENLTRTIGELFKVDFQKYASCLPSTPALSKLLS